MTIAGQRDAGSVVYPETDHMGEHELQQAISQLLKQLFVRLFAQRGELAHAGSNTFIYWVEGDPTTTIAPDVYVLPRVSPTLEVPCWKLWELDAVRPSFALEVASTNWKKDYEEAPALYASMGCEELVIFDPHATERSRKRVRFQHYRRDARGHFRKTPARAKDRVRITSLNLWLREVRDELGRTRLRIAPDDLGNELFATEDEARRSTEQALRAEVARLRAELAALERAPRREK